MSEMNPSRRSFFKYSAMTLLSVAFSNYLKGAGRALADEPLKLLNEKDPTAQGMGYHADASKVNPKKWEKRSGPTAKSQVCTSCQFYTAIDGKKGKCQIFPNNAVAGAGWCNLWTQKAG